MLGECIAKLANSEEKEWDQLLEAIFFAYRTKRHATTGQMPFYLIYERQATLPIDLKIIGKIEQGEGNPLLKRLYNLIDQLENDRQIVRDRIEKEQHQQKLRHDQQGISEKLKIGDKVLVERTWLKTNFSAKLEDKWIGPYFIHEVLKDNVYKLRTLERHLDRNLVHGN